LLGRPSRVRKLARPNPTDATVLKKVALV